MPRCPITASSERILPLPQPGKRLDAICWRFAMARSERGNYGSSVRTQERVAGAFAGQADGNAGLAIGAQRIDLRDTRRQRRVAGIDRKREAARSEEHTSELQSLMRISYAVFCLKKKHKKE